MPSLPLNPNAPAYVPSDTKALEDAKDTATRVAEKALEGEGRRKKRSTKKRKTKHRRKTGRKHR
jgi:hypothetical protein